jgi:hypothetical protein
MDITNRTEEEYGWYLDGVNLLLAILEAEKDIIINLNYGK